MGVNKEEIFLDMRAFKSSPSTSTPSSPFNILLCFSSSFPRLGHGWALEIHVTMIYLFLLVLVVRSFDML
jgi:hypothetical protein